MITPSDLNTALLRQQLATTGPVIRIGMWTPEALVRELGRPVLTALGLRPEPGGWSSATLGAILEELRGGPLAAVAQILGQPGWRGPLIRAIRSLSAARITPNDLLQLSDPTHTERLQLFAALLARLEARRRAEGLYDLSDLCTAALPRADQGPWAGAVVIGDRRLRPDVHRVLRAWLAARPHAEVRPAPWYHLTPAPHGLRSAVQGPVLDVPSEGQQARAVLARELFSPGRPDPGAQPIPADPSLVLAQTPDEVREIREAVRIVLDAIRSGTPLDRIAIVLPDASQSETLHDHLSRAGVPATHRIGPPLATAPAARFLRLALSLATGPTSVPAWHELLHQPGLQPPQPPPGPGAWRSILSRCGAVGTGNTIVGAITDWICSLDEQGVEASDDRQAAASLVATLTALQRDLAALDTPAPPRGHADALRAFLIRWWIEGAERDQVCEALARWGGTSAGVGPSLSLAEATPELVEALQATERSRGSLTDPAIRVLPPMGLLGGAFDTIAVTGLTAGRLPRRPGEDPVLPDALVQRLNEALGAQLPDSRDLLHFETRRFAAIVSAATGRLWLSAPATDFLEGRPLLPSALLLDVASVLCRRRAGYADLARLQQRVGSRARPWVHDPSRATDPMEHRVASTVVARRAGLRRLAVHPIARRQLGLHRALDAPTPTRWTGRLLPQLLDVAGLDGTPTTPWALAELLRDPGAFLVDRILKIRRPPPLYPDSDPTNPWLQDRQLLAALRRAQGDRADFEAAWDEAITSWRTHRDDVDDELLALTRSVALHRLAQLQGADALPRGTITPAMGAPVPGLPWVVQTQQGWVDQGVLTFIQRDKPARGQILRDAPQLVLAAMVTPGITLVRVSALDGRTEALELEEGRPELIRALERLTRCVEAGWWPWRRPHALRLQAEALVPTLDDPTVDAVCGAHP